ncbi:hypothetical protein [Pseudomonas syringae]|nr:hypothetical protein [Pseudomonas syringae]
MTPEQLWLISVLLTITMLVLMLRAQRVINGVSGDPQGMSNRRVTWINALWMVASLVLTVASIVMLAALAEQGYLQYGY